MKKTLMTTAFTVIGLLSSVSARAITVEHVESYNGQTLSAQVLYQVPNTKDLELLRGVRIKRSPISTFKRGEVFDADHLPSIETLKKLLGDRVVITPTKPAAPGKDPETGLPTDVETSPSKDPETDSLIDVEKAKQEERKARLNEHQSRVNEFAAQYKDAEAANNQHEMLRIKIEWTKCVLEFAQDEENTAEVKRLTEELQKAQSVLEQQESRDAALKKLEDQLIHARSDSQYFALIAQQHDLQLAWAKEDGREADAQQQRELRDQATHESKVYKLEEALAACPFGSEEYYSLRIQLRQLIIDKNNALGIDTSADEEKIEQLQGMRANLELNAQITALKIQQNAHARGTVEWFELEVRIQNLRAQCHDNLKETEAAAEAREAAARAEADIETSRATAIDLERLRDGLERLRDGDDSEATRSEVYTHAMKLLQAMPEANKHKYRDITEKMRRLVKTTAGTPEEIRACQELLWYEFTRREDALGVLNPDAAEVDQRKLDLNKLFMVQKFAPLPQPSAETVEAEWGDGGYDGYDVTQIARRITAQAIRLNATDHEFGTNIIDDRSGEVTDVTITLEEADRPGAYDAKERFRDWASKLMEFGGQRDIYKQRIVALATFMKELDLSVEANKATASAVLMAIAENSTKCRDKALNGLEIAEALAGVGANPTLEQGLDAALMLWQHFILEQVSTLANGRLGGEMLERKLFNAYGLTRSLGIDYGLDPRSEMAFADFHGNTRSLADIWPDVLNAAGYENIENYLLDNPVFNNFLNASAEYQAYKAESDARKAQFTQLVQDTGEAIGKIDDGDALSEEEKDKLREFSRTPEFRSIKGTKEGMLAYAVRELDAELEAKLRNELAILAVIENPTAENIAKLDDIDDWYWSVYNDTFVNLEFFNAVRDYDTNVKKRFLKGLMVKEYGIKPGDTSLTREQLLEMAETAEHLADPYPTVEQQIADLTRRIDETREEFNARREPINTQIADIEEQLDEADAAATSPQYTRLTQQVRNSEQTLENARRYGAAEDFIEALQVALAADTDELTEYERAHPELRSADEIRDLEAELADLRGQIQAINLEQNAELVPLVQELGNLRTMHWY